MLNQNMRTIDKWQQKLTADLIGGARQRGFRTFSIQDMVIILLSESDLQHAIIHS